MAATPNTQKNWLRVQGNNHSPDRFPLTRAQIRAANHFPAVRWLAVTFGEHRLRDEFLPEFLANCSEIPRWDSVSGIFQRR